MWVPMIMPGSLAKRPKRSSRVVHQVVCDGENSLAGQESGTIVVSGRFPHNRSITKSTTIRRRRPSRSRTPAPHEGPTDLRLGRIVRLLMEHATVVVSG